MWLAYLLFSHETSLKLDFDLDKTQLHQFVLIFSHKNNNLLSLVYKEYCTFTQGLKKVSPSKYNINNIP